ncbi:MAG: 30S ribosomal protein S17 [bacterium]
MERGKVKTREGVVVSNKMKKTVVVKTERKFRHPLYQKVVRENNKFKAHDEDGVCQVGDIVEIMETRPMSRDKRWRVVRRIKVDSAA